MEYSPAFIIYLFCVMFLCFFIKGLAGFGDPLLSNPLLSMVMENRTISPMNLLLSTPVNAFIAWKNRKAFDAKALLPIAICILAGVIPGTFLLKYGSSLALKGGLGVLILAIGVEMLTRNRAKQHKQVKGVLYLISFLSGITSGLYGINLFFVAYMERTTDSRESFRGNICFIFFIENIFRVVLYTITGVITKQVIFVALLAIPGMVLGLLAGIKTDKKVSDATIRNIIIGMFMLSGISILTKVFLLGT